MAFGISFEFTMSFDSWIRTLRLRCAATLAVRTTQFSRSWFWDSPDVTGTTPFSRQDSPSIMGPLMDRIGK